MKAKREKHRALVELSAIDLAADVPRGAPLFLGRFDAAALEEELREAGLFAGLVERGYPETRLRLASSGGEHRLEVLAESEPETLIDLRLAEESLLTEALVPRLAGLDTINVLSVQWLEMQDPRARFTPSRPQLPGQRHPGLRLTRPLILRIHAWAAAWGKDAVLNVPEYFHNAVFYSAAYRFLSPARQGRFEALRRDLAALPAATASAAVDEGRVVEEPEGRRFVWEAGDMLAPLTGPVRRYLDSSEWRAAAEAARKTKYSFTG